MLDKISKKSENSVRILLVGDIVGQPGLDMCARWIPKIKETCQVDGVVVNGENSSKDGRGITQTSVNSMLQAGASAISTGNHVWRFQDFYPVLDEHDKVIRPANFPPGAPGKGWMVFEAGGLKIGLLNLMGQIFLKERTDNPFRIASELLPEIKKEADAVLVDFHAEATSEKAALGLFLDGQVAAVFGTHTHVQTADHRVLPGGTAFMSDLGCVAALNSCLGIEKSIIIQQMQSQLPARFKVDKAPPFALSGALVDIDPKTGLAKNIEPIRIVDDGPED